jgi:hypothetical protein
MAILSPVPFARCLSDFVGTAIRFNYHRGYVTSDIGSGMKTAEQSELRHHIGRFELASSAPWVLNSTRNRVCMNIATDAWHMISDSTPAEKLSFVNKLLPVERTFMLSCMSLVGDTDFLNIMMQSRQGFCGYYLQMQVETRVDGVSDWEGTCTYKFEIEGDVFMLEFKNVDGKQILVSFSAKKPSTVALHGKLIVQLLDRFGVQKVFKKPEPGSISHMYNTRTGMLATIWDKNCFSIHESMFMSHIYDDLKKHGWVSQITDSGIVIRLDQEMKGSSERTKLPAVLKYQCGLLPVSNCGKWLNLHSETDPTSIPRYESLAWRWCNWESVERKEAEDISLLERDVRNLRPRTGIRVDGGTITYEQKDKVLARIQDCKQRMRSFVERATMSSKPSKSSKKIETMVMESKEEEKGSDDDDDFGDYDRPIELETKDGDGLDEVEEFFKESSMDLLELTAFDDQLKVEETQSEWGNPKYWNVLIWVHPFLSNLLSKVTVKRMQELRDSDYRLTINENESLVAWVYANDDKPMAPVLEKKTQHEVVELPAAVEGLTL